MATYKVVNCPGQDLALTNCVFVAPRDPGAASGFLELAGMCAPPSLPRTPAAAAAAFAR